MNTKKVLDITAAQLFLRIQAAGGEFRFWEGSGGFVCFAWIDAAGNACGGWEEQSLRGTYLVVYRTGGFEVNPRRRHARRTY